MTKTTPTWLKWTLYWAVFTAFIAAIFSMSVLHKLEGPVGYAAVFIWFVLFLAFNYFASARLKTDRIGPVMKRYRRRLAVAMIGYCVALLGSLALLKSGGLTGPLLWIVAAAPAVPILGVLAVMGLYLKEEPDEFERAIHVEAMLWGLGVVLAVSTVWGFLSNAEVAPAPPLFLIFPLFCASWGVGQAFIRRRYQ